MCKVLIIPNIKEDKKELTMRFIKEMGQKMSFSNTDGLGYAAVDKDGLLFGERWLKNTEAFGGSKEHPSILELAETLEGYTVDSKPSEYNSFGFEPSLSKAVSITLHTRFATSAKGMINTHPFVYPDADTSLIHNGIVSNEKEFKLNVSTCDSEAILIAYLKNQVNFNPEGAEAMAKMLQAYYACGVFSRDGSGNRILDVFKGNHAQLYGQYINELDTIVFATSDTDVKDVCDKLHLTKRESHRIKEGMIIRFNPLTGKNLLLQKFYVPSNTYYSRGSYRNSHWSYKEDSYNNTPSSNIIDVSNKGRKEREACPVTVPRKGESMTADLIAYFSIKQFSLKEKSQNEVNIMGEEHNWWKRAE